jgi:hypothetical protein
LPQPKIENWAVRVTNPDLMVSPHEDHPLQDYIKAQDPPLVVTRIGQFFLQGMMNRMGVSYHKYGSFHEVFPDKRSGVENALLRIEKYLETGNLEDLIDGANYLLIEFCRPPEHTSRGMETFFESEDTHTSPGALNRDGTVSHGKDEE